MSNLRPSDDKTWLSPVNLITCTHICHSFGFILNSHTTPADTEPWIYILTVFHLHLFNPFHVFWNLYYHPPATEHKRNYCQKISRFSLKNNKFMFIPQTHLSYGLRNFGIWHDRFMKLTVIFLLLFFGAFHCIKDILLKVSFGIPQM